MFKRISNKLYDSCFLHKWSTKRRCYNHIFGSDKHVRKAAACIHRCEISVQDRMATLQSAGQWVNSIGDDRASIWHFFSERFTNSTKFCLMFLFLSLQSPHCHATSNAGICHKFKVCNPFYKVCTVRGPPPPQERDGAILGLPPRPPTTPTLTEVCRCF